MKIKYIVTLSISGCTNDFLSLDANMVEVVLTKILSCQMLENSIGWWLRKMSFCLLLVAQMPSYHRSLDVDMIDMVLTKILSCNASCLH